MFTIDARRVYLVMTMAQTFSDAIGLSLFIYYCVVAGGFNPLQLVLVGTALEATAFLFEVPTGLLADNFSRRLSLIIGVALMGVSTLGQSLMPEFWLITVCQGLRGLAYTFINGADKAWLADEVGEEAIGPTLLFSSQLGQIVGILGIVSSVGLSLIDLRLPFVVSGLISLGEMVFLIVAMPERGFVRPTRSNRPDWSGMFGTFRTGVNVVRGRPVLILLLAVEFFVGASSEGYDRLWQSHLLTHFQFPSLGNWSPLIWFGLINLGGQLLSLLTLQLVRHRLDLGDRRRVGRLLLIMQGLIMVGCFVVGLAGSFEMLVVAAWARGVIGTIMQPLYDTWLILSIPSRVRATVISMSSQVNAFGQVAVGPGIGVLGDTFGTRAAIVTTGFLLLPNLVLYARLSAYTEIEPSQAETPVLT